MTKKIEKKKKVVKQKQKQNQRQVVNVNINSAKRIYKKGLKREVTKRPTFNPVSSPAIIMNYSQPNSQPYNQQKKNTEPMARQSAPVSLLREPEAEPVVFSPRFIGEPMLTPMHRVKPREAILQEEEADVPVPEMADVYEDNDKSFFEENPSIAEKREMERVRRLEHKDRMARVQEALTPKKINPDLEQGINNEQIEAINEPFIRGGLRRPDDDEASEVSQSTLAYGEKRDLSKEPSDDDLLSGKWGRTTSGRQRNKPRKSDLDRLSMLRNSNLSI